MSKWALLVLVVAGVATGRADDWPRWRGIKIDGITRETNWVWPEGGPQKIWQANVGTGFCAVAVSQGRLFTIGNSNNVETVWALDAKTGKKLWSHSYPSEIWPNLYEGGPNSTPTVDGETVYTLGRHGDLISFDAGTGKVIWEKQVHRHMGFEKPRWGFTSPALVYGDWIILNVGRYGAAFRKKDGSLVWAGSKRPSAYGTPMKMTVNGSEGFAIFTPDSIAGITAKDGLVHWEFPWKTQYEVNTIDPVVVGNRVFLSSPYGFGNGVLEVNGTNVTEVWKHKDFNQHFATPVLVEGHLYGIHGNDNNDARLKCVEFNTGRIKWSHEGLGLGNILASGDRMILLSDRGEAGWAKISTERFELQGKTQLLGGKCWTPPVLANGLLYCRNARGDLVCARLDQR
ncbi:MAG: PQQ-binding-like beta-propeller repeat protein [Verrucomicrobiota bacterium]|nr:PQQ-binding-like beta-propeller repeat protein [Verrucomicrobiota bacterium]